MKKYLFLILLIILFNCSSEDDNTSIQNPVDPSGSLLLKTVIKGDTKLLSYEYFDDDKIKLYNTYDENGILSLTFDYEYVNNEVIIKTTDNNGVLLENSKFYELNTSESQVDVFDANGTLTSYGKYNFSDSLCGATTKSFFEADDTLSVKRSLEYTDENCSSIITFTNSDNENITIQNIIRDDKNWFFKSSRLNFFKDKEGGI